MCCCLLGCGRCMCCSYFEFCMGREGRDGSNGRKKMAMYNVRKIRTSILQKVVPNVFIWGEKGGWEEG